MPILSWSKRIGEVLGAMPASWLIGRQVYRVFAGIFLVGWARGVVPGLFALPAGIGDAGHLFACHAEPERHRSGIAGISSA